MEDGYKAARLSAISVLATLRESLGSLDHVKRIVAVTGFISATDDFTEHPKVLNGASDLFMEVFGENGRHARSAVGVSSLPVGLAVEIEVVAEC
jgi:enamine deaminase RidA (YjgF/YER057c/UK114 family)